MQSKYQKMIKVVCLEGGIDVVVVRLLAREQTNFLRALICPHFSLAVAHEPVAVQKNRRTKIHPGALSLEKSRQNLATDCVRPFLSTNPPVTSPPNDC